MCPCPARTEDLKIWRFERKAAGKHGQSQPGYFALVIIEPVIKVACIYCLLSFFILFQTHSTQASIPAMPLKQLLSRSPIISIFSNSVVTYLSLIPSPLRWYLTQLTPPSLKHIFGFFVAMLFFVFSHWLLVLFSLFL